LRENESEPGAVATGFNGQLAESVERLASSTLHQTNKVVGMFTRSPPISILTIKSHLKPIRKKKIYGFKIMKPVA
jgi:hypothetical protein